MTLDKRKRKDGRTEIDLPEGYFVPTFTMTVHISDNHNNNNDNRKYLPTLFMHAVNYKCVFAR